MQTSEQFKNLAAALAKAQGEIEPASKDSENEAFKRGGKASKYADLAAIWEACRKPLASNGLAVVQQVARGDGGVAVTTRIFHASGEWLEFEPLTVPVKENTAHAVGSATTYGRRFALSAALGIVADQDPDDDGNAASGKGKQWPKNDNPPTPEPEHDEGTMTKTQARPEYALLAKEIAATHTVNDLALWGEHNKARMKLLPEDWQQSLRNEYMDHKRTLEGRATA